MQIDCAQIVAFANVATTLFIDTSRHRAAKKTLFCAELLDRARSLSDYVDVQRFNADLNPA